MDKLIMTPAPGERLLRFVGDRIRFSLRTPQGFAKGWRAVLRTNLGKAERLRQDIIATHAGKNPLSIAFWRDVPLQEQPSGEWAIELPLTDVGFYSAKPYVLDPQGRQFWPDGPDAGMSVHPSAYRTANTIYCAFPRMFGPSKTARATQDAAAEKELNKLDDRGYVVIPPSGTLRDLAHELPHIMDTLGCRIVQLLPVGPTPATFARFGRFGSPYACLDLTGIDPALVEFDQRSNGVEQFCELTCAVHRRGGHVLLDMVINHTGWGSTLYENHPEWFLRKADGTFASPGAWGVTWGDLVELNPVCLELWEQFAQAFLTWCRRGVDGFRCDAGYKVPLPIWQYIEARVRQEFPGALFLLEGLGGPLEATDALLTDGGMQWAYSELFQNYSGPEVARYLDYSIGQSERVGLYVHYSETHDNDRLAQKGRVWSLMRNRLSALASMAGGYGFTCGVEWLAREKIDVHCSCGLAWGSQDNLLPELAGLNRLLADHPCFFDGAKLERLSPDESDVYALRRESAEGLDVVLILVNTDVKASHAFALKAGEYERLGRPQIDLLGQSPPATQLSPEQIVFNLLPGAAFCLATTAKPQGLAGDDYRRARAQSSWAIRALGKVLLPEEIGPCSWRELAGRIHLDAREFLGSLSCLDRTRSRTDLLGALDAAKEKYPQVVIWTLLDRRRITPVPPGHWLLLQDERPFRAWLTRQDDGTREEAEAVEVHDGYAAYFAPKNLERAVDVELGIERYALANEKVGAVVRFLATAPVFSGTVAKPPADALVLLTNGRGGMARLCADLGRINSKYDCALGANLNPEFPVDRHIFAKRIRAWITADGFTTALNLQNLVSLQIGPPAVWSFVAEAGDGRTVEVQLTADMLEGSNTTVFTWARLPASRPADLPPQFGVHITVRVDIEDRNFHTETHYNDAADYHFNTNSHPLPDQIGFAFTPAPDRQLRAFSNIGVYHPQPEWCYAIPHPVEQSRGQVASGDAYSPGWFELPLDKTQSATVVLSAETTAPALPLIEQSSPARVLEEKAAGEEAKLPETDSFGRRLAIAARAFVARRGAGRTVIAGYPWFLDWGRDSFISARGLLAAGMVSDVAGLLVTFGRFSENGTMPNTIHGFDASNRDTSDAPLWYGIVCEETAEWMGEKLYETPVDKTGRNVAAVLREIVTGYARGTPNGIRMDAASGLIWSPAHFTWMDTNYPACTPRQGYPVEIQGLWIRLLRQVHRLGLKPDVEPWDALANRAEESLRKFFWLEDKGYIADLLIANPGQAAGAAGADQALRSNYLLAIAFGLFTGAQARRGVDAALRYLFVPGAVRTLAPLPVWPPLAIYSGDGHLLNNPLEPYWGRYQGDEDTARKPAYHNGTAWPWLLPMACEALVKAWDGSPGAVAAARAWLGSMDKLLLTHCLGQLPEILDGDAPHEARGCDAQAWSVTEALRVWKWLA
jgi:starch synthase (maltosyl-transferring)